MHDDIQRLSRDARRRLEHGFRQLEVLILQERLAALMGYESPDDAPRATQGRETVHV